jgi:hypothetical protein
MSIWTFSRKRTTSPFTWRTWRNGPNQFSWPRPRMRITQIQIQTSIPAVPQEWAICWQGRRRRWNTGASVWPPRSWKRSNTKSAAVQGYTAYYFVDLLCARLQPFGLSRVYVRAKFWVHDVPTRAGILRYYSGESPEDALDMRKALLPRDVHQRSTVPLDHPVLPEDLEW